MSVNRPLDGVGSPGSNSRIQVPPGTSTWRNAMPNLVLVVTVKVQAEYAAELKLAMLENASKSAQEETCYQFDVIVSRDNENSFMFYEVYKDTNARRQCHWNLQALTVAEHV
jgi:quinol monooxygenase YgiN